MAEVLSEYPGPVQGEDGQTYYARACAAQVSENSWHGWIEFAAADGGSAVQSPRETTQPNRTDTLYWATGLTHVYLEGALRRALRAGVRHKPPQHPEPLFDGPAAETPPAPVAPAAILDPFSIYLKGETLLRRQLSALSSWHLVNIVLAYQIPTGARDPNRLAPAQLIDAIAVAARKHAGGPTAE